MFICAAIQIDGQVEIKRRANYALINKYDRVGGHPFMKVDKKIELRIEVGVKRRKFRYGVLVGKGRLVLGGNYIF